MSAAVTLRSCRTLSSSPRSSGPGSWRATTTARSSRSPPTGSVDWSVGSVDAPILPRSCNKPLQALGMVRLGLDLPPDLLALACASHSGRAVPRRRRTPDPGRRPGWTSRRCRPRRTTRSTTRPARRCIRAGGERTPIAMNCSGKHAAMLATCVVNGWDTATYLDPDHPLQQAIAADLRGADRRARSSSVAVDGCGAPLLATSLVGLGHAPSARWPSPTDGPERPGRRGDPGPPRVRVRQHAATSATLLTAIPGAIGKAGAESCYAVALPDGRAFALKTDDGAPRVRPVLMAAALRRSASTASPAWTPRRSGAPASRRCSAAASGSARSGRPTGQLGPLRR